VLCPEWVFPKWRRNINEKDIHCAIREFIEETGYSKNKFNIVKNISPIEEIFFGSNYKSYKHKYYLALFNGDITDKSNKIQESEVSQLKWLDLDECLENIRHYNLEKKTIICKIDKILHKYRLIS
jgi:8-oxo-dGTP pyrophosphatase MutT (NUDIX family)